MFSEQLIYNIQMTSVFSEVSQSCFDLILVGLVRSS